MGNRPWINRAIVSGSLYNLMAWNREMPENSSPLLTTSGQTGPGEREGKLPEQRAIFNSSGNKPKKACIFPHSTLSDAKLD